MAIEVVDLGELAKFLVRAKQSTYAKGEGKVPPERVRMPGFKEHEYPVPGSDVEEPFYYRDHYTGSLAAPGFELVQVGDEDGEHLWMMTYHGGMVPEHDELAPETFAFLKSILARVPKEHPFRGPTMIEEGPWLYRLYMNPGSDISSLWGREKLYHKNKEVFSQIITGGFRHGKERFEIVGK